ncbi:unnamed protein product, partial [marine sediment metagenome]
VVKADLYVFQFKIDCFSFRLRLNQLISSP